MMHFFGVLLTLIIIHFGDCVDNFRTIRNRIFNQRSPNGWTEGKHWDGTWFPHAPNQNAINRNQVNSISELRDPEHGIAMGIPFTGCDDGKTNLSVDWDFSAVNYTCYTPKTPLLMDSGKAPVLKCDKIPSGYRPPHHCMQEEIHYNSTIPTYGGHRPLWPKFGEYVFVPTQRWLHNIEHGSIVMLYHPCAPTVYVDAVKSVVEACIWKHVVTPYNLVPMETPIVLVAWGCKLEISYIDADALGDVVTFIRSYGHHGPEGTYEKPGQYDVGLKHLSHHVPGSRNGRILCPDMP